MVRYWIWHIPLTNWWYRPNLKDPKRRGRILKAQTTQMCAVYCKTLGYTQHHTLCNYCWYVKYREIAGCVPFKSQCHIKGHWSLFTCHGLTSWPDHWGWHIIVCLSPVSLHISTSWYAGTLCAKKKPCLSLWSVYLCNISSLSLRGCQQRTVLSPEDCNVPWSYSFQGRKEEAIGGREGKISSRQMLRYRLYHCSLIIVQCSSLYRQQFLGQHFKYWLVQLIHAVYK